MDGYTGSRATPNTTLDPDTVHWVPSYTNHIPAYLNPSVYDTNTYPDQWQRSRHGNFSNRIPIATPEPNNTSQQGPRKRTMKEEQCHESRKRPRQEKAQEHLTPLKEISDSGQCYNATRSGTQRNPIEIESDPEQRSGIRSRITPSKGYIREPDPTVTWHRYYAVACGRVPGLYQKKCLAQDQVSGYRGRCYKKFQRQEDAWAFVNANREHVKRVSLCSDTTVRLSKAQPTQHKCVADHRQILLSSPPVLDTHTLPYATPPSFLETNFQSAECTPKQFALNQQQPMAGFQSSPIPVDDLVPEFNPEFNPEPQHNLSAEQQYIVDLIVEDNKNVFYTGSAGCGKSTILKAFVSKLKAKGKRVKIVAPTNLAALNVGGQTTWAFAGWTPESMKQPLDKLEADAHRTEIWKRFESTDVLVIDEISMVENLQFERLNRIMKASLGARRTGPFGGVQIIVTGDFCQLSPVKPFVYCIGCGWELIHEEKDQQLQHRCENKSCHYDMWPDTEKWAFRSQAWQECNFAHVNLTKIFRQEDPKFKAILNKIREDGVIIKHHATVLLNHVSETENAIMIYSLRRDVDRVNLENIRRLPSESRIYYCLDNFEWEQHHRNDNSLLKYTYQAADGSATLHQLKEHRYEARLELKEGMRVVLQSNLSPGSGLVNGAQGTIVCFEPYDPSKLPRAAGGKPSIIEEANACLKGPHARYAQYQIKQYARDNHCKSWPVVEFDNGARRTIYADCSYSELGNEEKKRQEGQPKQEPSLLSRTQIPLVAGYAITVHKSQGMTLDRVIVDLRDAFEASQIYVALSRARSLRGLKVIGLPRKDLGGANKQVKEFFETYLDPKKSFSSALPSSQVTPLQQSSQVTELQQSSQLMHSQEPSSSQPSLCLEKT